MKVNFSRFSVGQLRSFLIDNGYDEEEVNQTRKLDLVTVIQKDGLETELNTLYPDSESVIDTEEDEEEVEEPQIRKTIGKKSQELEELEERASIPKKNSPEWNDYVISLFTKDELIEYPVDGGSRTIKAVKCDGLRRVAQLALGTIIESYEKNSGVHYPDYSINKQSDLAKLKNPPFAWVSYVVVFEDYLGRISRWGGMADVNANNTDPKFLPFALSTAETKAEARALRKALGVKLLAIEELTSGDTASSVSAITNADWAEAEITDIQKSGIKRMCDKLNIDPYKLINCQFDGDRIHFVPEKIRNDSLDNLTNTQGSKILQLLNDLQQNKKTKDQSLLVN